MIINCILVYIKPFWTRIQLSWKIIELYGKWTKEYFKTLKSVTSERTITAAWQYVPNSLKKMNIKDIRAFHLKNAIEHAHRLDEESNIIIASDNIKSRIKSTFNLIFDYAKFNEIVTNNYARDFSLNGIQNKIEKSRANKNPFTHEQENLLWSDLDFGCTRMILINNYSGWRPQELINLEIKNIDLEKQTMIGGMKTDAGTNRLVPINPKIFELIKYYYEQNKEKTYLFYNPDAPDKPFTYDQYRGRFKKILTRHHLSDLSPSSPRHTFSTRAKMAHMDDTARKMIMGHVIYDVTDKHYTHLNLDWLKEELAKI